MNDNDAQRQIKQMIAFIQQEAKEKAEEIQVKTEAEFNAKKLNQIAQARKEIKEDFAKMRKEAGAQKRIARSRLINNARFEEMRERDGVLKNLKDAVVERMATVHKNPKYAELLRALITEALMVIMEKRVEVRCRKEDLAVVKAQLEPAVNDYKALLKKECNVVPDITVTLNETQFLAAGPSKNSQGVSCCGGVVLSARNGKIICRNTLDARFEKSFRDLLPVIREMLFGRRAAAVGKPSKQEAGHH